MTDLVSELPQADEYIDSFSRFDYDRLDAETLTLAQSRAKEIKILMKQTAQNTVAIGLMLLEVKECLGHGQFRKWLATEFDWSKSTANKFMNVALKCPQCGHLEKIAPSALYLLTAPSTPDAAREIALAQAAIGSHINHKLAKQIVAEVKKAQTRLAPAQPEASPTAMDLEPTPESVTYLPQACIGSSIEDENTYRQRDGDTATVDVELLVPDNTPECNSLPSAEISTCNWDRERGQLRYLIEVSDSDVGRKIECLSSERGKLPQTIVSLGIEALIATPEKERRITELILQVRALVEEKKELERATQQKNSRETELEQALAQKDSTLEELKQTLAQKDSTLEELKQTLVQKEQDLVQLASSLSIAESSIETLEGTIVELEEKKAQESDESEEAIAKFCIVGRRAAGKNTLVGGKIK